MMIFARRLRTRRRLENSLPTFNHVSDATILDKLEKVNKVETGN
jgi:hypothetical protein